ncbi:MAG: hypothetical protein V4662_09405 [Verrucomicrobiota bacterium]
MSDPSSPASEKVPLWLWPHLLSLEAPLVAMAWTAGLAHLHRVPAMPGVLPGLGLCAWIIYVLDRLMDTRGKTEAQLGLRHRFHRRHRLAFLAAVFASIIVVVRLGFWTVPADLMWQSALLSVPVIFYLALYAAGGSQWFFRGLLPLGGITMILFIQSAPLRPNFKMSLTLLLSASLLLLTVKHYQEKLRSAMSKDLLGGLLFALGCTAWSRFLRNGSDPVGGFVEFALLTCLFVSNLTGISTREVHHRWLAAGLGAAVGALALVYQGSLAASMSTLALSCAAGFILLLILDRCRASLSENAYRVLADVAVLVPVVGLYW